MDPSQQRAFEATGANFFLHPDQPIAIADYLHQRAWAPKDATLTGVEKAGEGNMNLTLRIQVDDASYILKQARPWVEKYPQIPAPVERNLVEGTFFRIAADIPAVAAASPRLIGADTTNFVLLLEDLGSVGDMTVMYHQPAAFSAEQLSGLLAYLSALHAHPVSDFPDNLDLRKLNHEHIFVYPYLDKSVTGFDLDTIQPGLEALAAPLRASEKLRSIVEDIGDRYLGPGTSLLHGDFYPGSWLAAAASVYVIDPEFAHLGLPEYDLGVLHAHLIMAGVVEGRLDQLKREYTAPPGFDYQLAHQIAGVEIIRRLIGLAQLPLTRSVSEKQGLLDRAAKMIVGE